MAFFTAARVSDVIDRRPESASPGDETRGESTARIDEKQHSRVWDGRTKRACCCCCGCGGCDAVVNERLRASALGEQKQEDREGTADCTAALQHAQQGGWAMDEGEDGCTARNERDGERFRGTR